MEIKRAEGLDGLDTGVLWEIEKAAQLGNQMGSIDHQDGDDDGERADWYRFGIYQYEDGEKSIPVCLTDIGDDLSAVDIDGNHYFFDFGGSSFGCGSISPTVTKEPKFLKMAWEDVQLQTSGYPDSVLEAFTPVVLRDGSLALILKTYDEPYGIEVMDLEFGRVRNAHSTTGMYVGGIPSKSDIAYVFIRVGSEKLM